MIIFITLSFAGAESGPFDLYSDVDGFTVAFKLNVSKADLIAGYEVEAPDGTTTVRLLDLGAECTPFTTDIYNCSTPNCDFSGEILCPYENCDFSGTIICPAADCNFTGEILCPVTTTTSTSTSTTTTTIAPTTTTTTTAYPLFSPCTWSTYGGNPGEIAVYDFNTNSSTAVLVPNDFTQTVGINRPICSTEDKLWLASIVQENDTKNDDDIVYIREWDINTSGATPTLSYVREMTIISGALYAGSESSISTIAVTSDNQTVIVGFGERGSNFSAYSWDISQAGDITLNQGNSLDQASLNVFGSAGGSEKELTGMFITNDDNVIVSCRVYSDVFVPEIGFLYRSNRIKQLNGLTLSNWPLEQINVPLINLQDAGVPDFTNSWTYQSKAMPVWGVDGLIQVIQPETLEVYNIAQTSPYSATLVDTVADDTVWIHTSTGCANVDIKYEDCEEAAWIPALTEIVGGEVAYTGPATFTYAGMQVIASAQGNLESLGSGTAAGGVAQGGCSGISNPTNVPNVISRVQGDDFSITLTFPQPVNNIPIRAGVLNTQPDFSYGDVYEFNTNTGIPTISISTGCNVQVQGNKIGGGVPDYDTEGDGEFIISSDENYTVLTMSGDAPTGGPLLLGCLEVEKNCTWAFPSRGSVGIDTVFIYNPINNTYLPQSLSNGFGFVSGSKRSNFSSENTLFYTSLDTAANIISIKRYDISQGLTYIDEVVTPTPPAGEDWVGTNLCAIDDNTLLLNSYKPSNVNYSGKIYKLVINIDGTTTITFLFPLNQKTYYWTGALFSNNKIIYTYQDIEVFSDQYKLAQIEYPSGATELEIDTSSLQVVGTSPDGYSINNFTNNSFVFEDKMYLLVSGIKLYEIDTTFPYNATVINDNTAFFGEGVSNNAYLRAFSNSGECSSNLSFIPTNETTTTTTSVTTLPPGSPNTIWIKFDPITPS